MQADMEHEPFRFYDNRQKYLLFVTTCDEKWVVSERIKREIDCLRPAPPSLGVFDAGMGDGTVLSHVLRNLHAKFPNVPFHVVGKEISLEDVRMSLDKMADRLFEHPQMVITVTNLFYREAPWLTLDVGDTADINWREIALEGSTASDFARGIRDIYPVLDEGWQVRDSIKSTNLVYERPSVLVLYRKDQRFAVDPIIPKRGEPARPFDLIIVSQPYQARAAIEFKARRVLTPLTRALAPRGRLILVQSCGDDPGLEIIRNVWPGESPFKHGRHALIELIKQELGAAAAQFEFHADPEDEYLFRYRMHMLPTEISKSIGTSTLLATWNAATYVAQIEDDRLMDAISQGTYLDATSDVLHKHGGVWFNDESFVIVRADD